MNSVRAMAASGLMVVVLGWTAGCGFIPVGGNGYVLDPDRLAAIAQSVVQQTGGGQQGDLSAEELLDRVRTALAADAQYGLLVDTTSTPEWVLNNSDGVPGQVVVLYRSPVEYLVFAGSPTSADWSLGSATSVEEDACRGLETIAGFEVVDFVLQGELEVYPRGQSAGSSYGPGQALGIRADLEQCEGQTYHIEGSGWMLEYGRGSYPSSLYEDAFAGDPVGELIAGQVSGLTISIVNEFIRNYIREAFGLGPSLGFF